MFRFGFIVFVIVYFFVRSSFAQQTLKTGIHHQFESTRAMGMGNAFVAVANDHNALFYNPAGLKRLKNNEMNFFIKGAVDPDIKTLLDDIDTAGNAANESQAFLDLINSKRDQNFALRAPSLGMIWTRPDWGVAFIPADVSADVGFQIAGVPLVDVRAYADTTLAYGLAWDLTKNKGWGHLSIGTTAKLINRAYVDKSLSSADLVASDDILSKDDAKEGLTLDADVGFLWTWDRPKSGFGSFFKPSAGLVVRNILDYGYITNLKLISEGDFGDPEDLQRRIDLGGAVELPHWWLWDTTVSVEIKDLLHDNWTFEKGYHIGAEFLWEVTSWWSGGWRVGLNQGHFTAGFTGQIWAFKMDLATYTNEIGTQSNSKESRLYMFTTSMDF